MISNNSNRMLDMDNPEDRELLEKEARRYLIRRIKRVAKEGRSVDNVDIHLWVSRFIHKMVVMGRLNDDDLAANIIRLTYALWCWALRIAEEHGQDIDEEVCNE